MLFWGIQVIPVARSWLTSLAIPLPHDHVQSQPREDLCFLLPQCQLSLISSVFSIHILGKYISGWLQFLKSYGLGKSTSSSARRTFSVSLAFLGTSKTSSPSNLLSWLKFWAKQTAPSRYVFEKPNTGQAGAALVGFFDEVKAFQQLTKPVLLALTKTCSALLIIEL